MGEAVDASFSQMAPSDIHALVAYLRTAPAAGSSDLPATLAGPAPASPRQGMAIEDARGRRVFEGACASCHDWTGVSPIIPLATLTGARAVNDPSAVNVAQVVISGAQRVTPQGVETMPAFGRTYSDAEIAAVANYVTARFGRSPSHIDAGQVAALRKASAQ
jgi:mono/diheme cytochrome c family protein